MIMIILLLHYSPLLLLNSFRCSNVYIPITRGLLTSPVNGNDSWSDLTDSKTMTTDVAEIAIKIDFGKISN
jgi:hypothetical protein